MTSSYIIAVDLGGTQIRAARLTEAHELEARVALDTCAQEGFEPVFGRLVSAVRQVWPTAEEGTVSAVGVGVPGPINFKQGLLRFAPNLPGWNNLPLRQMLRDELGVPVYVGNDADVAALAEHRFGDLEIRYNTVLHRPDRDYIARRPAEHHFSLGSDGQDLVPSLVILLHRHHRGLAEHDALALHVNQGVGGAQVDRKIV